MDPQPSLLLAADASVVALNPALQAWRGLRCLLGCRPTMRRWSAPACASTAQSATWRYRSARTVLWTFMPDDQGQQVLGRCRDASEERQGARETSRARRLYRLIIENTTDLISRHSPDGRFLDASPAAHRLLGLCLSNCVQAGAWPAAPA